MSESFEKGPVGVEEPDAGFSHVNLGTHSHLEAAIPNGQVDPVYEAKARVLNAAVRTMLPAHLRTRPAN